jgi:hypothetical protein
MSTRRKRSFGVKIVSWPPLWPYWPAYLALARTQKPVGSDKLTFHFELLDGAVTDERLRATFFKCVTDHPRIPTIALCEPREAEIPGASPSDRPHRAGRLIQRLPLIWRQPHWVFSREDHGLAPTDATRRPYLWRFPADTTSGDFVAQSQQRLMLFRGLQDHAPMDLTGDLARERAVVGEELGPHDRVVTFTPWHRILETNPRKAGMVSNDASAWRGRYRLADVLLPGPARDVTALQVPDDDRLEFVERLAAHIKGVIDELSRTQGEPELIRAFFDEDQNFDKVRNFLAGAGCPEPAWLDRDFLEPALGEYVRLGCYFPYRTIDSAISAEIQKRVGEVLDGVRSRALSEVRGAMTNFLGGAPAWHAMSFQERLHVFDTQAPAMDASNPDRTEALYVLLSHRQGELDARPFKSALTALHVRTEPGSPIYQLDWLVPSIPAECAHTEGASHADRRDGCLMGSQGRVAAQDALGKRLCAACVASGAAVSVARPAAAVLAQGLTGFSGVIPFKLHRSKHFRCAVAFSDVQGLVDLFVREQRPLPTEMSAPPAEIALYNSPPTNGAAGQVLFGIWWRGGTQEGGGTNRTLDTMMSWARSQRGAGRPVAWVGLWRPGVDGVDERQASDDAASALGAPGPLAQEARQHFLKRGFAFGYTALFHVEKRATSGTTI